MLALDSTIGCIEVAESEVLDLFRSAPVTRSSSPGSRPESMEAHLCAIRKKTLVKVYLTFVVNDRKIFVYTAPGKGTSEAEYSRDLEEALECARAMGFSPERVDLSYSPAMREVVVRNSKILRLPGAKVAAALKQGLAGAPTLPIAQKAQVKEEAPPATTAPTPLLSPAIQAPPASRQEASEPGSQPKAETGKAHQALLAERDALTAQLRQLSLQHQQDAEELSAAREACAALTAEKEAILGQARQTEEELHVKEAKAAQALDEAAGLATRLEALTRQHASTEQEHEAMVENLAQARQDLAQLAEERDAALESERKAGERQRETAAKLEEAHLELERLRREREDASQRLTAVTQEKERQEQELAELRRLLSETEAAQDAAQHRAALLEQQQATAESEPDDLRGELQRIGEERDDALRRATASDEKLGAAEAELADLRHDLADLRRELEQVQAERDQALPAAAPQLEKSPADDWPYRPHLESPKVQQKDDGSRQSPLPLPPNPAFGEVARFEEFNVPQQQEHDWSATPPSSGPTAGADVASPPPGQEEPFFVPLGDLAGGGFHFGADDGAPILFMLESGLSAIEVRNTEDVLELHHSINNAYLSPEGNGGQESCQGYICCLRKEDKKEVFAAIYGTQSKRTRVYLPEEQPQDDDSYVRTVRGAICFAEEVGLMMEPVSLEGSAEKKMERLKRCPALRLVGPA
ncbi:hypothetical protein E4633_11945 [Geomonas terrae]|uniref:Uncharacterized protein n=1 Tax=Geomonas terrae TaxID=2562681 RepID=A0A4S1CCD6_9BACT|nr:hypothetical protein [Geomonas terrae]TGU71054.1 hypothetical protein E4633_11945 [Geomonas terrae]